MHYLNSICPNIRIDGRAKNNKKIAQMANVQEFDNTFKMMAMEAQCSRWDVDGLPDTCDRRVIQQSMFANATVGFIDKNDSLISLPTLPAGNINVYGYPCNGNAFGRNGYTEYVNIYVPGGENTTFLRKGATGEMASKNPNCVLVRENDYIFPFMNITASYAYRIANLMRTLDTEFENLAHPYLIAATEDMIQGVKDYFNRRDNHESWIDIISSGVFDPNKINVIPLEMSESGIRDCTESIEWLWQMYRQLEYLDGSKDVDKKAEITIPELQQGSSIVNINGKRFQENLEEQFDIVNKVFGTHMKPYLIKDRVEKEREQNVLNDVRREQQQNPDGVPERES